MDIHDRSSMIRIDFIRGTGNFDDSEMMAYENVLNGTIKHALMIVH